MSVLATRVPGAIFPSGNTSRAELAMIWKGVTSLEYGDTGAGGK